jgi:Flp pilus assembly protein TadG
MRLSQRRLRRSGAIAVLMAVMLVMMFGMMAFAVDLGFIAMVRTELQSSADSAALAATMDLLKDHTSNSTGTAAATLTTARATAGDYAGWNVVGGTAPGLTTSDVTFGRLDLMAGRTATLKVDDARYFNATRISVRRQGDLNGEVPTFFARVLGSNSTQCKAEATAAFIDNFQGFKAPAAGDGSLDILPFAMDKQTWDALMAGSVAGDSWTWNETTGHVTAGPDGVREVNLYPQGTGSPGNRGTVDIGSSNNSTADISRQIRQGISAQDLASRGGKLELGPDGTTQLEGDTGISAGVKDDLASIIGKPRIIPIFSSVSGPGNNAKYTIVAFAGVRIMDVRLTGNMGDKRVTIQPARIELRGGIPAGDSGTHSYNLYSPVWLVR